MECQLTACHDLQILWTVNTNCRECSLVVSQMQAFKIIKRAADTVFCRGTAHIKWMEDNGQFNTFGWISHEQWPPVNMQASSFTFRRFSRSLVLLIAYKAATLGNLPIFRFFPRSSRGTRGFIWYLVDKLLSWRIVMYKQRLHKINFHNNYETKNQIFPKAYYWNRALIYEYLQFV
jgi:hypothetical protein